MLTCLGVGEASDPVTVGSTLRIMVTYEPSYTTETGISWSSSDTTVATVDDSGVVTLLDNGTVTITATSTDRPEVSSSVRLTITGGTVTVDLNGNTGQNEAE